MPKRKAEEEGSGVEEERETEPSGTKGKNDDGREDRPQKDSSSGASNKQAKKSATKKQGDGSGVSNKIELGNKKFVDVREFKGMILIDIREYYEKDGEMKPTKKGIALSVDQWEAMKDNMDDITERVEALKG